MFFKIGFYFKKFIFHQCYIFDKIDRLCYYGLIIMYQDRFSAPRLAGELFKLKYPWSALTRREIRQYPGFAKEIRGTVQGSIIEKAAEDIIFELNKNHGPYFRSEDGGKIIHFPRVIGREEDALTIHYFKTPKDLREQGETDFNRVNAYIKGLFRKHINHEKMQVLLHHAPVMITLRRAQREMGDRRRDLFEALGIGIEIISTFVNSTKQLSQEKGIDHLTLIGNSIPLLVDLAKQNSSTRGNGGLYEMFALKEDDSEENKAFQKVKEAFLDLPIQQAQDLIIRISNRLLKEGDWNDQFRQKIKEGSEIIKQILGQQVNKNLTIRQVVKLNPQLDKILEDLDFYSKYSTVNHAMRQVVSKNHNPALVSLKHAINEFAYKHEHKKKILNPAYFIYNEETQALEHKRNSEGKELIWQVHTPDDQYRFSDLEPLPTSPTIGCSAMLLPLKSQQNGTQEQINTFFSQFPKSLPKNAIGLGVALAYLASI